MVLQVAFDDSGNSPNQKVLVLGGLLSTAKNWVRFTRQWEAACKKAPGAAYVKYSEIVRGTGEFSDARGWTDDARASRLSEFVAIIVAHVEPVRFFRAMEHAHFIDHIRSIPYAPLARTSLIDTPYTTLGNHVAGHVVAYLAKAGLADSCDFYFDTAEVSAPFMTEMWPIIQGMPATIPLELFPHGVVPALGTLNFRKDEEFLPLQAADLVAGLTRDELLGRPIHKAMTPIKDLPRMGKLESESEIRDDARDLRRRAQHFRFLHPEVRMITYEDEQKLKKIVKRKQKAKAKK